MSTCKAPGCSVVLGEDATTRLCPMHWKMLPTELQNAFYKARHKPDKYDPIRVLDAAIQYLKSLAPQSSFDTDAFIERAAAVAYGIESAYRRVVVGDYTRVPWGEATRQQRQVSINAARYIVSHPDATAENRHDSWRAERAAEGWRWGLNWSDDRKTDPRLAEFRHMPYEMRLRDEAVTAAMRAMVAQFGPKTAQ